MCAVKGKSGSDHFEAFNMRNPVMVKSKEVQCADPFRN